MSAAVVTTTTTNTNAELVSAATAVVSAVNTAQSDTSTSQFDSEVSQITSNKVAEKSPDSVSNAQVCNRIVHTWKTNVNVNFR